MATTTDNRIPPKTGAESEFDNGVGAKTYRSNTNLNVKQDSQNFWPYIILALLVLGGGIYYFSNYGTLSSTVPAITETTTPPKTTTPDVTSPPVAATPDANTPPVAATPDATTPPPVVAPLPPVVPQTTP
jgi:hypothetical protein